MEQTKEEITKITLNFNEEDREMMDKLRKHVNDNDASKNPFPDSGESDNILLRLLIKKAIKLFEDGKIDSIF